MTNCSPQCHQSWRGPDLPEYEFQRMRQKAHAGFHSYSSWKGLHGLEKWEKKPFRNSKASKHQVNMFCSLFVPPDSCSCSSAHSVVLVCMASSSFSRRRGETFGQQGISFSQYISTSTAMGTGNWNKRDRLFDPMTQIPAQFHLPAWFLFSLVPPTP